MYTWQKIIKFMYGNRAIRPKPPKGREPWVNTLGYYKFDSNTNDDSWNWYNGTWSGASSYTTGKIWDSASFGWSSSISLPSWVKPSWDFTLSFRIKHNGNFVGNGDAIISTNYWGARWWFVLFWALEGGYGIQFRNSSWSLLWELFWWTGTTYWSDNTRHHIAATYDNSTKIVKAYLDWTYISSVTLSGSPVYTTNVMTIGKSEDSYWEYYTWWLDELIIENKTRTSTDVLNYYNLTK